MSKSSEKIPYFAYWRKSSDDKKKQIISIPSQKAEMLRAAKRAGIHIAKEFSEEMSAKAPGRPIFNEMLERIKKGEAQGIVCWKLDRLSRNPIDGGQIVWMLQEGIIKHILTNFGNHYPKDNVLPIQVELGMANQYVRDLSVSVKRGLEMECERGFYPAPAPLGYLDDKLTDTGKKQKRPDSERLILIRKLVDLMLTGEYSVPQLLEVAHRLGLRTGKGKLICRSHLYNILSNPFYFGEFEYPVKSGRWYKGDHQKLITREEYDKIQALLGKKGRPRPKSRIFEFTGMMRCGECESIITAEKKVKQSSSGKIFHYVYYHCDKHFNKNCSQGSVRDDRLKAQIIEVIQDLKIPPEFHEFAMKWFRQENHNEFEVQNAALEGQRKRYKQVLRKLESLLDMRAGGEITEEEYKTSKEVALSEKASLEAILAESGAKIGEWIERGDEMLTFLEDAVKKFETGSLEIRRDILSTLGSKLFIKDGKLMISMEDTLLPMQSVSKEVQAIHDSLETPKDLENKGEIEGSYTQNPRLLGDLDSNQDKRLQRALSYH